MGTDCAPLVVNLFLFYYEYKYMRNLIKCNLMLAKRFSNTMRYIDDLLTLNNISFHSVIDDIYPEELTLKQNLRIIYSTLIVRYTYYNYSEWEIFYDKRDIFIFRIVNFPYLSSNTPSGPAYGVFISQLVCIGRICSNYSDFALRNYKLTERLINQGY